MVVVLCAGCSAGIAEGNAPKLAIPTDMPTISMRFEVDGSFSEDLEKTIDWVLSSNSSIRRTNDLRANASVYLTGTGQARWAGNCTVRVKAIDDHGALMAESTRTHYCGWPGPHGDGVRAAVRWAIEETALALTRRSPVAAPAVPSAPAVTAVSDSELTPRGGGTTQAGSVALIIGIDRYRDEIPAATGAEADADLFQRFAVETLGVPRAQVRLLVGSHATKSSIDAELNEWLPRNSSPSADVYIFFAGHGAPEPTSAKRYLVPWDANPEFIARQGIALNTVLDRAATLKARHVVLLIDACFSGLGGRSVLAKGTRPIVVQRDSLRAPARGSVSILSATGPNQTTGTFRGHGLFSYYLFQGLNGAADLDRDGTVSFNELARYTRTQVSAEARRQNRDQETQATGKDVVLVRGRR
jgi:hypothetical protein